MQKQNKNGMLATTFSRVEVETYLKTLEGMKLGITNWFLAKVDDLYSPVACNKGSHVSSLFGLVQGSSP